MSNDSQSSQNQCDQRPLRVATAGRSASADYHLEAAAIRPELVPIAAAPSAAESESTEPVPGCPICSIDELAGRSDVDVVFVCEASADWVHVTTRMMQSGKHVVIEPSCILKPEHLQRVIDEAETTDRFCTVWRPLHDEPDFCRAAQALAAGEAGYVRAVRFLQHEMSAAVLPKADSSSSHQRLSDLTLRNLLGHRIAQAMMLVDEPVRSADSFTSGRSAIQFGAGDSIQETLPAADTLVLARLTFESGATALIDIGLSCPVSISTGWIIQGSRGGYHAGRQHITVEDGEIYDVAVDVEPSDPYLNLRERIHNWPGQDGRPQARRLLQFERTVAEVLQEVLD